MLWLNFDEWLCAGGPWFYRKRLYWKGYVWTPFIWVRPKLRRVVDIAPPEAP